MERRADPADRRAHRLFLTERARPLLDRCRALADTVYDEAFAGIAGGAREYLTDVLVRVRGNLSERRSDELSKSATAVQREPAETAP